MNRDAHGKRTNYYLLRRFCSVLYELEHLVCSSLFATLNFICKISIAEYFTSAPKAFMILRRVGKSHAYRLSPVLHNFIRCAWCCQFVCLFIVMWSVACRIPTISARHSSHQFQQTYPQCSSFDTSSMLQAMV